MKFTCLSQEEVRRKYREADDKRYIIEVIAGLTSATNREVMEFLGFDMPPQGDKPRKPNVKMNREEAKRMYDAGLTDQVIAKALGVSKNAVGIWRRKNGLESHGKPSRDNERMEMYLQGLNDVEIAQAVGVTPKSIQGWRVRHGLKANATRGGDNRKKKEGEKWSK